MRLKLGDDLLFQITGKKAKRMITSAKEVLALKPELVPTS